MLALCKQFRNAVRWHLNEWMLRHIHLLGLRGRWLTVMDAFGAPGDTLMAATVCRIIRMHYPGLKINLVTKWPELVRYDPSIDLLNATESYFTLRFWYLETVVRKECVQNVLMETLQKVKITDYTYRARVFLTEDEKNVAERQVMDARMSNRPILGFCSQSKERVKNWPLENWRLLIERLAAEFELVQLGDEREPIFEGVSRFAGELSMRESMAVLSRCDVFVGPDSFLMHTANGLGIPSVIIFGGSRPPACLGYTENVNLFVSMPCGPCWLHDSRGDVCPHGIDCMNKISVEEVELAIRAQFSEVERNSDCSQN